MFYKSKTLVTEIISKKGINNDKNKIYSVKNIIDIKILIMYKNIDQ